MTEAAVSFAGNLTDDPELRHTEGTQPHPRRETFLHTLKAGPAARQRHDGHRELASPCGVSGA
jgi:single-stranded DNA-binding protein